MVYTKSFYYSETQSSIQHSWAPVGAPDIKELIEGNPYWIPVTLPRIEKPKTLVLADWTAKTWTSDKIDRVIKSLGEFMDQGFSIYMWRDGHVSPITKKELSTLNNLKVRESMTLVPESTVSDVAVRENNLTLDQVQVIDDYWLNHILSAQEEPQPRVLRISEIPDLKLQELHELIKILKTVRPALTQIIHDEFSIQANKKAKLLADELSGVEIKHDYVKVNFSGIDIDKDTSDDFGLSDEQLKTIKSLDLAGKDISDPRFLRFLTSAPKLRKLHLAACKSLDGELNLEQNRFPDLDFMDLSQSNLSRDSLKKLLAAAPKLRRLSLAECNDLDQKLSLAKGDLSDLDYIDLSFSNLSSDSLNILLAAASNLRTLNLRSCESLNATLDLAKDSLADLDYIDLSFSNLSSDSLNILLAAASNLRTLNLRSCKRLDAALKLDKNSLANLEVIDLSFSNLSSENLTKFLAAVPRLRMLDLRYCERLNATLDLSKDSLEHLNYLDLSFSNLSSDSLNILLAAASNLRTLNLGYFKRLDAALELDKNSLAHLDYLDVSSSNISRENLTKFLAAAPNLRTLKLGRDKILGAEFNLDKNSFKHLESLDISGSDISSENLNKFLAAAPNLRTLKLGSDKILDAEFNLDKNSFKHLESLDISDSDISSENLNKFLAAAPKLRRLNLSYCQKFFGEINLDKGSLPNLEVIDLDYCNLSHENLNKLLIASPNTRTMRLIAGGSFDQAKVELGLQQDSLLNLESLEISRNNILVNKLLAAAPNIRTLKLTKYYKLHDALNLAEGSLSHLELLDVSDSSISMHNVGNFLASAPKLRALSLASCTGLDGELRLDKDSFLYLESLDVSKSNISLDNFNKILAAAPNLDQESKSSITRIRRPEETRGPSVPLSTGGGGRPVESTHNSKNYKDFKPKSPDEKFEFKGTNKTKNQGMIIEKLSQYLTQKKQHVNVISKLQDGICYALSYYFLKLEQTQWNEFVDLSRAWNGQEEISSALSDHFDALYTHIRTYQFHQQPKGQYIGDGLQAYLDTKTACILTNPWHAIAIRPISEDRWQVYDPNYVTGYQEVSQNELLETLHTAIGDIVSIEKDRATHELHINDPDAFMENGGLLALCACDNAEAMLSQLPDDHQYSEAALDGILLRSTSGKPAWVIAIANNNPAIRSIAKTLKKQFEKQHSNSSEKLIKSMDALTPYQHSNCVTQLVKAGENNTPLINAIRASANKELYAKALNTWDKTAESQSNFKSYGFECLKKGHDKRLIELNSTQHLDTLRLQLEQQALDTHRPVFYVDKPDDLICSAPWMKKHENGRGELCKGPGGPLYDFLQENQDKDPLILVNYERFNADDMIRFNGLLDKDPNADGTVLPKKTMIIGLINRNKPDCYQGSDFYSRFNRTERCPLTSKQLDDLRAQRTIGVARSKTEERISINLYHAPDWESRLLGRWVLDGDVLSFSEGELVEAMKKGKPIEIQNGLWGDEVFDRFWQQILSGKIRHAGRMIEIPENIHIIRPETDGYTWDNIPKINHDALKLGARVLNPTSLNDFLGRYEVEGNKLIRKPGWIEEHQKEHNANSGDSLCVINVTRTLTDDAWAMLLDECKQRKVELSLHVAPGVELPKAFNLEKAVEILKTRTSHAFTAFFEKKPFTKLVSAYFTHKLHSLWRSAIFSVSTAFSRFNNQAKKTQVTQVMKELEFPVTGDALMVSTDIDTTVAMLTKDKTAYSVIDVSECTSADLLVRLDGRLNKEALKFEFSQSDQALKKALAENQNIILKGHFSPELLDALAPVLLERQNLRKNNQLVLVTPDTTATTATSYLSQTYAHTVSTKDKLACLALDEKDGNDVAIKDKLDSYLEKEPLSKLQARSRYLKSHPMANSDDAWLGMAHVSGHTHAETGHLEKAKSEEACAAFTTARKEEVNQVLKSSPYVFLTGLSGVGKSTFVETELCNSEHDTLYLTEHSMQAWAKDDTDKRKILFLDEANLSTRQWSEFEGLFNTPPSILIDGVLHHLNEHHKVVFAGNPVSYGDERTLAPLFQRHGNAVLFTTLPPAVIYEKILKPVFSDTGVQLDCITDLILKVYSFVCECSETEVLISPRELQMMALLTRTRAEQNSQQNLQQNIDDIAEHFVYTLAKNLVPKKNRAQFDEQFKPKNPMILKQEASNASHKFFITPSRQALSQQISDLINLCQWRRSPDKSLNAQQKTGGLGGMIIEGEPGIGKSELVIAELITHGYTEEKNFRAPTTQQKPFYRMPVSMPLSEKEDLLIKAFNEGAVVMIDEINSSPMMERLLNDLLMGKNPRPVEGVVAKPGFMVIGTQNPVTMAGRRVASTALQRRLITIELPEYNREEIKSILLAKGIQSQEADAMVDVYESNRTHAIQNNLSPVPNFRNLIELADNHLKSLRSTSQLDLSDENSSEEASNHTHGASDDESLGESNRGRNNEDIISETPIDSLEEDASSQSKSAHSLQSKSSSVDSEKSPIKFDENEVSEEFQSATDSEEEASNHTHGASDNKSSGEPNRVSYKRLQDIVKQSIQELEKEQSVSKPKESSAVLCEKIKVGLQVIKDNKDKKEEKEEKPDALSPGSKQP